MGLPQPIPSYTPEEYLVLEREADTKHEYLDGQIYAMAGASPVHNQICFNIIGEIHGQLKGTPCFGYTSDQKIRTDPLDLFTYPDITIVCGEPKFHDDKQDVILNPKVIIEVLSPTTEAYDRGEKFARYQQLKSLTDYILVAQDKPRVEHYVRQKGKKPWLYSIEHEMTASVGIDSIGCKLKLADVYDRIVFPPPRPPFAVTPEILPSAKPTANGKKRGKSR